MGNTEKRAIWVTIVILILATAYYMVVIDSDRQNELSEQIDKNKDQDGDFNEAVEISGRLESKLEGHYKHFRTLQDSARLHYKAYDAKVDSINLTFDKVILKVEQLEDRLNIKINNLSESLESLDEELDGLARTNKNKFISLEKELKNLTKELKKINAKWEEEFGPDED